jgi:DNA repair protein RecO (recombination protein O)
MTEQTRGIILRTYPLTETSLVVQWLTADFGRIATAARGARRTKSPFRGKLDLFYEGRLSFERSRRSELHALREIELTETHGMLRRDLASLNQAAYCAALIEQTTERETAVPELFALLKELLEYLPSAAMAPRTVYAFELKLLAQMGLNASQQAKALSDPVRAAIRMLELGPWREIGRLKLERTHANELRQFLHGFLVYHLGKLPATREAALHPA